MLSFVYDIGIKLYSVTKLWPLAVGRNVANAILLDSHLRENQL